MKSQTAHVLISRRCVNRCVFCTVAGQRERGEFPSSEAIRQFLYNMAKAGTDNIVFSGLGEPTLDPSFEAYLTLANRLNFRSICLFTNGYGLTLSKARHYRNNGLSSVLLSLHGIEEDHDLIVGRKGSYREAIRALEIYLGENIKVNINTCITRSNLERLPELCRLLASYAIGVHALSFLEWTGNVCGDAPFVPDYGEVADFADQLVAVDDRVTLLNNIPFCLVRCNTCEQNGMSPVQLLNGKGDALLEPTQGKVFPEVCYQRGCRLLGRCPGFEPGYLRARGWQDIKDRVNRFLDEADELMTVGNSRGGFPPLGSAIRQRRRVAEPRGRDDFVVVVKPTNRCNGACRYCSCHYTKSKIDLTLDRVHIMYREVFAYVLDRGIRNVSFLWHGGEPLLMGTSFYEQAWAASRAERRIRVKHMIQSNLLELNREWIELLQHFDVPISTSVEPLGQERLKKNGLPQYPDWLDSFLLACEARLNLGLVLTVTSRHLGREAELYSYLKNLQSLASQPVGVRINPVYPAGKAADCWNQKLLMQPLEYGKFLVEIGQLYQRDDRPFPLHPIQEWLDQRPQSCEFSGGCHARFISMNGNGDIFHCGRFSDSMVPWGNLHRDRLATILENSDRAALGRRQVILRATTCRDCPYWHLCKGGCTYHAHIHPTEGYDATPFCRGYRQFFEQNGLSKLNP